MDPASFAFAVIGTVDLCIKYGKYLVRKYDDYKNAERDMAEIVLNIQSLWLKTEIQLESITKLWKSIDPRLQQLFYDLLNHLRVKLKVASEEVDRVATPGRHLSVLQVKKLKAMAYKSSIVQATNDLENWQRRFDPSWYLITRVADSIVDNYLVDKDSQTTGPTEKLKHLREAMKGGHGVKMGSVFIDGGMIAGEQHQLPFSTAYTSHLTNGDGKVLVDITNYNEDLDTTVAKLHVRDLARRLANSDPGEFGLLHCRGVVESPDTKRVHFRLVFDIPPGLSNPRTLRDLLLQKLPHPLDQRFKLAKQLVRSLMFVHTSGFVHKNIRPETIVVFQEKDILLGPSFLIGFERFRPSVAGTVYSGDANWERNLYRHLKRQGLHPEDRYVMQHDIYGLGVCLLEIGFWTSFVQWDGDSPSPGTELGEAITEALLVKKSALAVKQGLLSMATEQLPRLMGQRYADLAMACLTCLDPGDANLFGREEDLEDEDGIIVGVQYIEKILLQIDDISV
ncbi:hypothetical protein BDV09DRAFT_203725 [Aspergillus tetrazonus]